MSYIVRLLVLLICLGVNVAGAQPPTPQELPPDLRPWQDWVLWDLPQIGCPALFNDPADRRCLWLGRLRLVVESEGIRFSQTVRTVATSWLTLPGMAGQWPRLVRVNGGPAAVTDRGGRPSLLLEPGEYQVDGRISWSSRPEFIQLPEQTRWIDVVAQGRAQAGWHQDEQDRLWLSGQAGLEPGQPAGDSVQARVFRKLEDAYPKRLTTVLELDISGRDREIMLGRLQLEGFSLIRLESPLPARIEPNGALRVQAKAGQWRVRAEFRQNKPSDELSIESLGDPWPSQEVWVFQESRELRVVELSGVAGLDPSQTLLPAEWRNLPAYLMQPGEQLKLSVLQRGDAQPAPNLLRGDSTLWLDFSGEALTWRDRIQGRVARDWRLNVKPGVDLGRVSISGEPQLVSRVPGEPAVGVEIRPSDLSLETFSRVPLDSTGVAFSLPVTGLPATLWQSDFQEMHATLHLPPGWKALGVSNADYVEGAWLDQWSLWDIFIVLLSAVALGRIAGWLWGGVALFALTICYQETDAPILLWLNLAAAVAIAKVASQGRLYRLIALYRNLSLLALVIWIGIFAVQQVRLAIYPQLERPWQQVAQFGYDAGAADVQQESLSMLDASPSMRSAAPKALYREALAKPAPVLEYDSQTQIQTGPGEPQWSWSSIRFGWSGLLEQEQQFRLWLLSPVTVSCLRVLQVLLMGLLLMAIFRLGRGAPGDGGDMSGEHPKHASKRDSHEDAPSLQSTGVPFTQAPLLLLLPLLLVMLPWSAAVHADLPDAKLLEQLKLRLATPPECSPHCAALNQGVLTLDSADLKLTFEVSALTETAIPVPLRQNQWQPERILLNGAPLTHFQAGADGYLLVRIPAGTHELTLEGGVRELERLEVSFPLPVHNFHLTVDGWQTSGFVNGQMVSQTLRFERSVARTGANERQVLFQEAAPVFAELERRLVFGLTWEIRNRVRRIAPERGVISLDVPLLPGESVTSSSMRVEEGIAKVVLTPEQDSLEWTSRLEPSESLELTAGLSTPWAETWSAQVGPLWHLSFQGVPPVKWEQSPEQWMPAWKPYPGERLLLNIQRVVGAEGAVLSIDQARLVHSPGQRGATTELHMELRSSLGSRFVMNLPEGAALQSLALDGAEQPLAQDLGRIDVALHPGRQAIMARWVTTDELGNWTETPSLGFPVRAQNLLITLNVPAQRWVLWVNGPALGPAVLYWGMLIVLLLASLGLGRHQGNPLRAWQWMLLALGISLAAIEVAVLVVLWFYAMQSRRALAASWPDWQFNLVQIGLVLLTLAAIGGLIASIPTGLLSAPDMHVVGNGSSASQLNWYQDRVEAALPHGSLFSVSLFWYRAVMLFWSLWLAFSLIAWLRWGWQCYAADGLWRDRRASRAVSAPVTETEPGRDAAPPKTEVDQ